MATAAEKIAQCDALTDAANETPYGPIGTSLEELNWTAVLAGLGEAKQALKTQQNLGEAVPVPKAITHSQDEVMPKIKHMADGTRSTLLESAKASYGNVETHLDGVTAALRARGEFIGAVILQIEGMVESLTPTAVQQAEQGLEAASASTTTGNVFIGEFRTLQ